MPLARGRLTRLVDLATATTFAYDALGRVTRTARTLDGVTYVLTQAYNALDAVTAETFPDGDTVTYTYNEAGALQAIPGYVTGITYNARGQRTQVQYANGVTTTLTYDPLTFRLTSTASSGPAGTVQSLSYGYDVLDNINRITDTVATASRTFGYDALNRLAWASGTFGANQASLIETYRYDAAGNLLQKGDVAYAYSDLLHPSAVTGTSTGGSYAYDLNGNMTARNGHTLTWDADNRLASITTPTGPPLTFAYDAGGERVSVAWTLGTLAGALRDQGRHTDASRLYGRALSIAERTVGPSHPGLVPLLHGHAEIAAAEGRVADAERWRRRASALQERAPGSIAR